METKWVAIMVAVVLGILCLGEAVDDYNYNKSQCRIEAIRAGVEADKINTACGVK